MSYLGITGSMIEWTSAMEFFAKGSHAYAIMHCFFVFFVALALEKAPVVYFSGHCCTCTDLDLAAHLLFFL